MMTYSSKTIAATIAWALAACLSSNGESAAQAPVSPDLSAAPNFWDEIPASPSTTLPRAIQDDYWHGEFERVNREVAQAEGTEMIFFGDSITWQWTLGGGTGQEVWKKRYAPFKPINMGNSGDITPVMLYRVTHGNLDFPVGKQPKVAVLLCGTNNFVVKKSAGGKVQWDLGADCPPEEVAAGSRAIAQEFRRRLPSTRVIMLGILPVSDGAKWAKCQQVNAFNAAFSSDKDEVVFLDLQDKFLKSDGTIDKRLYTNGTHLTEEGYEVWAKSIEPVVSAMMKAKPLDPLKVMLIGDSITEGLNSATSYRRYLDGMLRREGTLIDFVGSRNKHNDNKIEPDDYGYDVDHEAHWGKNSEWLAKKMPELLKRDVPDVAMIHMGTEDIVASTSAPEPLTDEIIGNISKVVEALRSKNRKTKLVLAKIIPVRGKDEEVQLLNLKIARYANAHATTVSPIVVADLNAGFNVSTDLRDGGIFPNPTGAKKMAQAFFGVFDGIVNNAGN